MSNSREKLNFFDILKLKAPVESIVPTPVVQNPRITFDDILKPKAPVESVVPTPVVQNLRITFDDFLKPKAPVTSQPPKPNDQQIKWYTAASTGDLQTLIQMVATYPGIVHLTNPYDRTALHAAASIGRVDILEFLLNQGADLKSVCKVDGFNAMDYAIYNNQYESFLFLSSKGLMAVKVGTADYVLSSVLPTITNENKVFAVDAGFEFPVDYAVFSRLGALNFSTLNTLSKCQAALQDINTYLGYLHNYIHHFPNPTTISARAERCKFANAFWQAKKSQIQKMTEALSVKGFVQHYVAHKGYTRILEYWIQQGVGLTIADSFGNTPLHVAAANGHLDCVKSMIEKADPKKNYLVNYSLYPNSPVLTTKEFIDKPNKDGLTALHLAAISGQVEVMQYLMSQGADINAKSNIGWNAFDYAEHHKKNVALNWLKTIKEISFADERIYVANHHEHANEWLITSSSSQKHFSFCVREDTQSNTMKEMQNDVQVLVTERAINEAVQQLAYVNPTERKAVAVAALGITSLSHFQESLANPTKHISNYGIKDEDSLAAVHEKIEKSDVKIVYSHGMVIGKTSTTEWGLAMMDHYRQEPSNNKTTLSSALTIAEQLWSETKNAMGRLSVIGEGVKGMKGISIAADLSKRIAHSTPDETFANQLICAPLGTATQFIGSTLVTFMAAESFLAADAISLPTGGLSLFAVPVIIGAYVYGLKNVKTASDTVQNKCEDLFKEPIEKEKPINESYRLGNTVKFVSQPFFTLSSSIQSMPIFNQPVVSTKPQTISPLNVNLPTVPSASLKTASTQPLFFSTANLTANLTPKSTSPFQQDQDTILAKEKQQTALYLQKQVKQAEISLVVKQSFTQSVIPTKKSTADYDPCSTYSHSIFSSSDNSSSVVMSSGGPVTDSHGNAVTTSSSVDYYGGRW